MVEEANGEVKQRFLKLLLGCRHVNPHFCYQATAIHGVATLQTRSLHVSFVVPTQLHVECKPTSSVHAQQDELITYLGKHEIVDAHG